MLAALLAVLLLAPGAFADDLADPSKDDVHRARMFSVDDMKRLLDRSAGAPGDLQAGEEDNIMSAAMEEMRAASSDVLRALLRLEPMRDRYRAAEDLSALDGERNEARRALVQAQGRFTAKFERFETLKKMRQSVELTKLVGTGLRGGHDMRLRSFLMILYSAGEIGNLDRKLKFLLAPGETPSPLIQKAIDFALFSKEMRELDVRLHAVLQDDEDAYDVARKAFEQRRLRRRALIGGGAAGALLLAGAGLWLLRRKRRPAAGAPGPGDVIAGNYRVERELGRGGMGLVFEATDLSLRRKVAVKRLREELKQSPRDLEAFLAEARVVAALRHPHIVEIYAVINDGNDIHLVFELVEGQPLNVALERAGRLRLDSACALVRQVGSALDFAHANGVIHRDLKPANVMLTAQGAAKVTDFGLAHRVSMTVTRLTGLQSSGTPPYMAPEQELGESSRESDLYSLGAMLYEAVTGKVPFPGPNYLAQKRERVYVPPSQAAPGLPGALDDVIRRALDPEPGRRFHSAAELMQALSPLASL